MRNRRATRWGGRGRPTRVIELVGLPGSGKSTIARALHTAGSGSLRLVSLGGWQSLSRLIVHARHTIPTWAYEWRRLGRRRWRRLATMTQCDALAEVVARERAHAGGIVLLDQGPIYLLSILHRVHSGEERPRSGLAFAHYWRRALYTWRGLLDGVILLDAADQVLYARVLARTGKPHRLQELTADKAALRLASYRHARDSALHALRADGELPEVLALRTDELSVEDAVARIRRWFDSAPCYGAPR